MIRVKPQPEPVQFSALVSAPGTIFLKDTPRPTSKEFESHAYWRRVLADLRAAYGGICAYSSFYVPECTGTDTVEHFLPKTKHPSEAYRWANYRFVCQRLNQRKGTKDDVIDPFIVQYGWFWIEFPSLLVKPFEFLPNTVMKSVKSSIDRVGLNDEGTVWKQRQRYTRDYCTGSVTFKHLLRDAPFLAIEIRRQGLVGRLNDIMKYR
jgi:hypothetical protein